MGRLLWDLRYFNKKETYQIHDYPSPGGFLMGRYFDVTPARPVIRIPQLLISLAAAAAATAEFLTAHALATGQQLASDSETKAHSTAFIDALHRVPKLATPLQISRCEIVNTWQIFTKCKTLVETIVLN